MSKHLETPFSGVHFLDIICAHFQSEKPCQRGVPTRIW